MKSWLNALAVTSSLVQLAAAIAPSPTRWASECTAVGKSIYCYGGIFTTPAQNSPQSDTWSIDVSTDFALNSASWTNVTHNGDFATTPCGFEAMVPLKDGVSFLVNGGMSIPFNQSEVNQTTIFNTVTKTWTAVNSSGIVQARQHTASIDASGRVWLWGGLSDYQTGYTNETYWGAFTTLDPGTGLWTGTSGSAGNAEARVGHTMTMTSSGVIYIIGGLVATRLPTLDSTGRSQWSLSAASMSDVPQYNTNNGEWNLVTASGYIPPSRNLHTATLAADGTTVIVFGGSVAVQVGTTMFVMFGYDYTLGSLSDIHALDTVNWRWVTQYSATGYPILGSGTNGTNTTTPNSGATTSSSSGLGTGAIAGIAVGAAVVIIGAAGLLFLRLRRKKNGRSYEQAATGNFAGQPPMQDRPMPPLHQHSGQPEEILFNNTSQSESKGSFYGQSPTQQHLGSQGLPSTTGTEPTDATPPYTLGASQPPHTYGTTFTSKPDAADVPHFTLQPSKPNEDD
ncbi:hypothetical protein INT44_007590 [Umbelopsis vinacea]|uniref:Galactose oxidase n=1 Tax=Umbelopsis vinacea TaxID=44442 RepID=A0A8H7PJG7_9FUNG|nr:hypothetical protein INT44_007590 [Umbelopsis vinacea]